MRARGLLPIALALTSWASVAPAQAVSEADRQAARELFQQGYQLQQSGKYADALDKFSRAQAVFSAPTNLLHIAECQAQLGLLVESAETYRGLINLALPANAPTAFLAAQTQGRGEIQQVEARVPKVRIEVTPSNPPGLVVTIDGQPMNTALVGVDRPIDPGQHSVAVVASGYGRLEKTIAIKEKEPPQLVSFALQGGGVVVTPGPAPSTVTAQAVPPGTAPPVLYPQPYAVQAVQPYGVPIATWTPPKRDYTYMGFFFGGRIGAAIPAGGLDANESLSQVSSPGASLDLEGYFRFGHKWFLGLYGGHDFFRGPGNGATSWSNDFGTSIGFTTNPEGVGFMLDLKLGYRWYGVQGSAALDMGMGVPDGTYTSVEGGIGMGIWIALGKSLRIVPLADVMVGSLSVPEAGESASSFGVFFVGVAGYFNVDIGKKPD
jgi:hypothetical protein